MNNLHALMLAELLKRTPDVNMIIELDISATQTIRLSKGPVSLENLGHCYNWISKWSDVTYTLSGWRGGIEAVRLNLTIDDTSRQFTSLFGRRLRRNAVRVMLVGRNLPQAAFHVWFKGVVDASPKDTPNTLQLQCRMNDDALKMNAPHKKNAPSTFATLPGGSELLGKALPYIVGTHDSSGLGANGMIACAFIGVVNGKWHYLVGSGWWLQVPRVFSADVEKSSPADFTVLQTFTHDLSKITVVAFEVDQGSNAVVVDVLDITSAVGPAAAFTQMVTDIGWNDFHGDHLSTTLAPIDLASVTDLDTFLVGALGFSRGYYVASSGKTLGDMFVDFLLSFNAQAHWTRDGKIRFIFWEHRRQNATAYLNDGRQLLDAEHYEGQPTFPEDAEGQAVQIAVTAGLRPSSGANLNSRTGALEIGGDLARKRDMKLPWQPATAESVGNQEYMLPNATDAIVHFPTLSGGATIHAILSQGPPPAAIDLGKFVRSDPASTVLASLAPASFTLRLTDMPDIVAAANIAVWVVAGGNGADSPDQDKLEAQVHSGATVVGNSAPGLGLNAPKLFVVDIRTTDPNTGQPWTRTALTDLKLDISWDPSNGSGCDGAKMIEIYQIYVIASYTAAANVSPSTLAVVTRELKRWQETPDRILVPVPLSFLDFELGDDFALVDRAQGYFRALRLQGQFRLIAMTIIMDDKPRLMALAESIKNQMTSLYIFGKALIGVDGASAAGNGMLMMTVGATVSVACDTPDFLESPVGLGVQNAGPIVRIFANCWPSDAFGTLVGRSVNNYYKESCFNGGLLAGASSPGSGTITLDADPGTQLFQDSNVTTQHMVMKAGSPNTTGAFYTYITGNMVVLKNAMFMIYHRDSSLTSGDPLTYMIQSQDDDEYWNNTTKAWQVSLVRNVITGSLVWDRYASNPIPIKNTSDLTYLVQLGLLSGGTVNRQVEVGQIDFQEETSWTGSPVVTGATVPVARAERIITVDNDKSDGINTYYTIPNEHGGILFEGVTNWNSADLPASTVMTGFRLRYDGNNEYSLIYTKGTGFVFKAKSGGTSYNAIVDFTVVRGVHYAWHLRWTASYDTDPLILTLVVRNAETDVVIGSAQVAYVMPVFAAAAKVGLLSDPNTANVQFEGRLVLLDVKPVPPTDEEMGL